MDKTMALKPRLSEKAYAQSLAQNTFVFGVPITANKLTVADAVAAQFEVTVEEVRIVVVKGKTKQSYRKGRRPVAGKRADVKKAYVRLKDGDTINIFGEPEDKKADKDTVKTDPKNAEKKPAAEKQKRSIRQALSRGGSK